MVSHQVLYCADLADHLNTALAADDHFWLDLLNFRRKTRETGWKFKALFVIVDDVVVDKLWSGDPYIVQERDTRNPLGPFQDFGGLIMRAIP